MKCLNKVFNKQLTIIGLCVVTLFVFSGLSRAEDWPMYRANVIRSGSVEGTVGPNLTLQWKYIPTHSPRPAWPMPAEEMPRMHDDSTNHVVAAKGNAYFGCSITGKVHSISAAGEINWMFFAEGPVRFAPVFYKNRIYFGSDDGFVYCLNAQKGQLLWKYPASPSGEKVIGNGQMISLWPVRGGLVVDENIVYFSAGVFPYEGIYICALSADDGSVIWKNDTIGDKSHGLIWGGISPHGYLLASKENLFVPSSRAVPAAFSRKTGKFLFYRGPGAKAGGTWAMLDRNRLIAGVSKANNSSKGRDVPVKSLATGRAGGMRKAPKRGLKVSSH